MSDRYLSPSEVNRANKPGDPKDSPEVEKQKQQRVSSVMEDWNKNIRPKAGEGGF